MRDGSVAAWAASRQMAHRSADCVWEGEEMDAGSVKVATDRVLGRLGLCVPIFNGASLCLARQRYGGASVALFGLLCSAPNRWQPLVAFHLFFGSP
jgi:hypothetical protein